MVRFRSSFRVALAATVAVLAVSLVAAQTEPDAGTPTAETETAPPAQAPEETLGASDILPEAEQAIATLQRIRDGAAPADGETEIDDNLAAVVETIDGLEADLDRTDTERLSRFRLERMAIHWDRVALQLDRWENSLEGKSAGVEADTKRVADLRELWNRTAGRRREQDSPEALLERIDSVLTQLDEVDGYLRSRLDTLVTLESRILQQESRVQAAKAKIDVGVEAARGRVLTLDAHPVWRLFSAEEDDLATTEPARELVGDFRGDMEVFLDENRPRLLFTLALLGILVAVLISLRSRGRIWAKDDPRLERPVQVLTHPVAAAFLVTLIAAFWVWVRVPPVVVDAMVLALLVTVLRILPALIDASWRIPLYAFGVIFTIDRMCDLPADSPLVRLLLLVNTTVAIAGFVWLVRRKDLTARGGKGWWQVTAAAARLAAALLTVSVIANLVGNVTLSSLLSHGVMSITYSAVALFAGVTVITAAQSISIRRPIFQRVRFIRAFSDVILRRTAFVLRLGALTWWVWILIGAFELREVVRTGLTSALTREWPLGQLQISAWNVVSFVLTIWASIQLSRFVQIVLENDVLSRLRLPRGIPGTISMMARYGVLAIGFLLAGGAAGLQMTQLTVVVGALGVGIGFGLQNVVNNFVSGLILAFERPIQIGDTIETQGLLGEVRNIGIRTSTIRTFDGAEVIIPNGNLISAELTNWTLSDRQRRITLPVGVAYGTDPSTVVDLLLATVKKHEDVLGSPEPQVLFIGFGDSSLDFEVRVWTTNFDRWRLVSSQVAILVNDAIKEAGIEIPFPQRDLHVRSVDPSIQGMRGAIASPAEDDHPE